MPSRRFDFCSTSDTADIRSTTTFRVLVFLFGGRWRGRGQHHHHLSAAHGRHERRILRKTLEPLPEFRCLAAERQRARHRQVRDGRLDFELGEECLGRVDAGRLRWTKVPIHAAEPELCRKSRLVDATDFRCQRAVEGDEHAALLLGRGERSGECRQCACAGGTPQEIATGHNHSHASSSVCSCQLSAISCQLLTEPTLFQCVLDRLGRCGIRHLWPVAAVVDVLDPDLARVERVDGHPPGPGEELDAWCELRSLIPAVGDEVEELGLASGQGADEVLLPSLNHRRVQPPEALRVDALQFGVLTGHHVDPGCGAGCQCARRSLFDRNDQIGEALEGLVVVRGERLGRVHASGGSPRLAGHLMDFLRGQPIDESGRRQHEPQPS